MQKITPFLWFDGNAEEAINFYLSIFKNGKIINQNRQGDKLFGATFEIEGQQFMVLNGGPMFKFTEAISLYVNCETQEEVDDKWEKLSEGGEKSRCGWLKDKYGLSWQIIPSILPKLLSDPDHEKAMRVMQAMMKMGKLEIETLRNA
jgi:predicted 3-demethylubiquinone-9 3-methyltransferase (glyoxalase superfamily)